MIKQGIFLLSLVLLSTAYNPVANFNIQDVLNKSLYLNAILSANPLNLTLDNGQSYCAGYYFTSLANGNVLSMYTLLSNYTSSTAEFTPTNGSSAEWKSTKPLSSVQWESLGTSQIYSNLTFIYADTTNDMYGAILFGNGDNIGDLFLLLSSKQGTRFGQLAKVFATAVNDGFTTPYTTYSFMDCMGYSFNSNPNSNSNSNSNSQTEIPIPIFVKGPHGHHRHHHHHHYQAEEEEMSMNSEEEGYSAQGTEEEGF